MAIDSNGYVVGNGGPSILNGKGGGSFINGNASAKGNGIAHGNANGSMSRSGNDDIAAGSVSNGLEKKLQRAEETDDVSNPGPGRTVEVESDEN